MVEAICRIPIGNFWAGWQWRLDKDGEHILERYWVVKTLH